MNGALDRLLNVQDGLGLGGYIQPFLLVASTAQLHSLITQIVEFLALVWRQLAGIGGEGSIDFGDVVLAGAGGCRHGERQCQCYAEKESVHDIHRPA